MKSFFFNAVMFDKIEKIKTNLSSGNQILISTFYSKEGKFDNIYFAMSYNKCSLQNTFLLLFFIYRGNLISLENLYTFWKCLQNVWYGSVSYVCIEAL